MRGIKFRGLLQSGVFIFGSYVTDSKNYHAILRENPNDSSEMLNTPVIPESVGQFTGLKDKNGGAIYEGDIVKYLNEYQDEPSIHFVHYEGDKGYPAFELSPELGFECNGFAGIYQGGSGHIIVIGNIHQNPELLEQAK
jgi:hypothetical protein